MSRYTGPKIRKVRRFGEDFAMNADRSTAAKFVKNHHKYPPGAHGSSNTFKKHTGYGLQLLEKQKAKVFYHITEKPLRRYYAEAIRRSGSASDNLVKILESRLDNVIYRAGLANSHPAARQFVSHAQFLVNGRKVNVPSLLVKAGDKITFAKQNKLKDIIVGTAQNNHPVSWLKVDSKSLEITVTDLPTREEIEAPFNEQLIIEFYSR
ncbi:TPA: 30S ribosomal protein S4 [Patescibacteria group bacterium]|nr:30S ribosomal protein S4 [Patescibacteria group bacterium]